MSGPAKLRRVSTSDLADLCRSRSPLSLIASHLAPGIVGLARARQAVSLVLLSPNDEPGARNRTHCLLVGPPGTAKTSLIAAAAALVDAPVYGHRMSIGALSYDFRRQEPGALGKAHSNGFFFIDELEKIDGQVLTHLFGSMEGGSFTVAARNGPKTIRASVRVVATANTTDDLPDALLSRFDLIIHVAKPSRAQSSQILGGIVDQMTGNAPPPADEKAWWRGLFAYVGTKPPAPPNPAQRARIRATMGVVLQAAWDDGGGDIRKTASVLRVAKTLARLRRQPFAASHVLEAGEFVFPDAALRSKHAPLGRLWERLDLQNEAA